MKDPLTGGHSGITNKAEAIFESGEKKNFVVKGTKDINLGKMLRTYREAYFYSEVAHAKTPKVLVSLADPDIGRDFLIMEYLEDHQEVKTLLKSGE
jgi:hypothetical protein